MGVVVFDSDVLIGFLNRDDAHHQDAVAWMRDAMAGGHPTHAVRGRTTPRS